MITERRFVKGAYDGKDNSIFAGDVKTKGTTYGVGAQTSKEDKLPVQVRVLSSISGKHGFGYTPILTGSAKEEG